MTCKTKANEFLVNAPSLTDIKELGKISKYGLEYLSPSHYEIMLEIPSLLEKIWEGDTRGRGFLKQFYGRIRAKFNAAQSNPNCPNSTYQKIAKAIDKEVNRNSKQSIEQKDSVEQRYYDYLNNPATWDGFKRNAKKENLEAVIEIQKQWERQKYFALCTNKFLSLSFETTLIALKHVNEAEKELEQKWIIDTTFAKKYSAYIKDLKQSLILSKYRIMDSMFLRLRICNLNLLNDRNKGVDDILLYFNQSLARAGVSVRKDLFKYDAWTTLDINTNIEFYHVIKKYGYKHLIYEVNNAHWSKNVERRIFLSANSADRKINDEHCIKPNGTILIVPPKIRKYLPNRSRFPSFLYWQDSFLINFWQDRQELIAKLHALYPIAMPSNQQKISDDALDDYLSLLEEEIESIKKIKLSFFAFKSKEMVLDWDNIVKNLHREAVQNKKQITKKETHSAPIDENANINRNHSLRVMNKINEIERSLNISADLRQEHEFDIENMKVDASINLGLNAAATLKYNIQMIINEPNDSLIIDRIKYLYECVHNTAIVDGKLTAVKEFGDHRNELMRYLTRWLKRYSINDGANDITMAPLSWYIGLINILGTQEELQFIQNFFPHEFADELIDNSSELETEIDEFQEREEKIHYSLSRQYH